MIPGMLAVQRQREILDRIRDAGSVRVAELARQLEVTEETIRRDLEKLDRQGKVSRIHGGAVPVESDRRDLPFDVRETVNLRQKQAIARKAAEHIEEGDVIALDASSTARELARVIPDITLTVLTNCLAVTTALLEKRRVRVISTGGILDAPSLSYIGPLAERALDRFNIEKLFLSCKGIDIERGLSVTADEQATIKRRMMHLAAMNYLLVDSSKFGVRAVEFFAAITEIDVVITDGGADDGMIEALAALAIRVENAEP